MPMTPIATASVMRATALTLFVAMDVIVSDLRDEKRRGRWDLLYDKKCSVYRAVVKPHVFVSSLAASAQSGCVSTGGSRPVNRRLAVTGMHRVMAFLPFGPAVPAPASVDTCSAVPVPSRES